jgi:hypothetical protein
MTHCPADTASRQRRQAVPGNVERDGVSGQACERPISKLGRRCAHFAARLLTAARSDREKQMVRVLIASVVIVGLAAQASAGRSPGQKCQGSKNQGAGKYASCLFRAEAKLLRTAGACSGTATGACFDNGDCPIDESCIKDPGSFLRTAGKCEEKFERTWDRLTQRSAAALDPCRDGLLFEEAKVVVDECVDRVASRLAGEGLSDCDDDLAQCSDDLLPCEVDVDSCSIDLASCSAGTAAVMDVLVGRTFSSAGGLGVSGTMPNRGAVVIVPGISSQAIPEGFHSGLGAVAGDPDLAPDNIRGGAELFGVSGSLSVVDTSGSTATPAEVRSGKTAWVNGSLVTGTAAVRASFSGPDGQGTIDIPDGLYLEPKQVVVTDVDLVASRILLGVNIFGVTGSLLTAPPAQMLETSQTQCWDMAGTPISCVATKMDGELRKGLATSLVDNGDGTVTDNRTGLMWEKLGDDGSVHDVDDQISWADSFAKITTLNTAPCFAGHCDWRMPNVFELQSLVSYGTSDPAVRPPFGTDCMESCTVTECDCTQSTNYWSATSLQGTPSWAWTVHFNNGSVAPVSKADSSFIRAVRSDS